MSLQTNIISDLERITRDLRTADRRADDRLRGINIRATRQLLRIARAEVHVVSGRLQAGLAVQGPFNIASGVLEAQISAPSVPYAAEEAARGGAHDYAARTLAAGAGVIDQAAEDMEQAIIDVMEGR